MQKRYYGELTGERDNFQFREGGVGHKNRNKVANLVNNSVEI